VRCFEDLTKALGDAVHLLHCFAQPPTDLKLQVLTAIWAAVLTIAAINFSSILLNPGLYIPWTPGNTRALCGAGQGKTLDTGQAVLGVEKHNSTGNVLEVIASSQPEMCLLYTCR